MKDEIKLPGHNEHEEKIKVGDKRDGRTVWVRFG